MRTLIKGGRLVDPSTRNAKVGNLLIEGQHIKSHPKSTERLEADGKTKVIDAGGLVVAPGLVDLHATLGEPGFEHKETILTGSAAAAAGGFTSVVVMPNTIPVNDNAAVTEYILFKARTKGAIKIFPLGALSKGLEGESLADIGEMREAGCVGITDNGRPTRSSKVMRLALEYAKGFDITVFLDCHDPELTSGGMMNEGYTSMILGLRGIPSTAEEMFVARNIALAELTGARIHVCHVSTAASVRLIREVKKRGVTLTCDTAPHFFTLTEEAVINYDTHTKTFPPLRTDEDVDSVKEGLRDGTIDAIASCHAPHTEDEMKVEFDLAPFGISSLETTFSFSLALVRDGVLSLSKLIEKLSTAPAVIIGQPKGSLKVGSVADIVVFDEDESFKVETRGFLSKGKNCPFDGLEAKGRVKYTLVEGKQVFGPAERTS